jgi:hypothetical protein
MQLSIVANPSNWSIDSDAQMRLCALAYVPRVRRSFSL